MGAPGPFGSDKSRTGRGARPRARSPPPGRAAPAGRSIAGEPVVAGLVQRGRDGLPIQGASLVTVTADVPPGTRSTLTPVTPPRPVSSALTARTQCPHVMPVTR